MKTEKRVVRNLVAKHAHEFNKSKVQDNKLKELARKACRGREPNSMFWLI